MNSIFFDELYKQFSRFDKLFTPVVKNCSNEFFFEGFEYKLVSASTNMNVLSQNDTFFVTKVKINTKNDIYIRISEEAINVILNKVLGKNNKNFDLGEVSELEARIITAFNDFLYETLAPNFHIEPHKRYSEILHLTFFVKSEISDNAAKFIISIPKDILSFPSEEEIQEQRYTDDDFRHAPVEVNFLVGTTVFPLADIKKLDVGDIVVFENSNSSELTLVCENVMQKFQITPNEKIIEPYEMSGGNDMDSTISLWDSLQVDMSAEFDKVKVTLGELKSIEEGLIVDLCSVYDNKVTLKVGGKNVANGELVIINDRFGVRIQNVADTSANNMEDADADSQDNYKDDEEDTDTSNNEDFDYSDFEVDQNQ